MRKQKSSKKYSDPNGGEKWRFSSHGIPIRNKNHQKKHIEENGMNKSYVLLVAAPSSGAPGTKMWGLIFVHPRRNSPRPEFLARAIWSAVTLIFRFSSDIGS